MTQKYVEKLNKNGMGANGRPDPEVLPRTPKAERRAFTAVSNTRI